MLVYRPAKTGSELSLLVYRPARTGSGVTVNKIISVGLPASQEEMWCDC